MSSPPPVALTIAGSDCCAGAGLQADLKTFSAFHVHGLTAVTSVVAETSLAVHGIYPVEPAAVQEQIRILLEAYPVAAIKTGMLGSKPHVVAVAEILSGCGVPIVVDPVMIASSGDTLLAPDALKAYRERLLPLATLLTPNRPEARELLDDATVETDPAAAAEALAGQFGCSVLVTGGHDEAGDAAHDHLWHENQSHSFASRWIEISSSHGTGCTLSAAITANLALGLRLADAVRVAKLFIQRALEESYAWKSEGKSDEMRAINQLPQRPFPSS